MNPPSSPEHPPSSGGDWDLAEICMQRTAEVLHELRAATPAEISQAVSSVRESHAAQKPADLIEALARVQCPDESQLAAAILALGQQVASMVTPYAPYVPFAGKLITPTAFYEAHPQVCRLAEILGSPVIYAEDTDAVGTASINPVASQMLSKGILEIVTTQTGIRPFVSIAQLDFDSWNFLTRKHFSR